MNDLEPNRPLWWHITTIYQVYPRSFQDSNRDGVGDLRGILRRLDYLVELGIGTIWLSPIFRSPMADFGYDVSDHTDIDPLFGSLADFDELLHAVHRRGLKLLLDLVPNHTSDQHPWFLESRSSRDNPKRDWYLWRDPGADGGPPNNWLSEFGGSAWTFDPPSGQYYGHAFLPEQPDLNWRNAKVRDAVAKVDFGSLYGKVKFQPNGQISLPQTVIQIQKGEVVEIFAEDFLGKPRYPLPPWAKR